MLDNIFSADSDFAAGGTEEQMPEGPSCRAQKPRLKIARPFGFTDRALIETAQHNRHLRTFDCRQQNGVPVGPCRAVIDEIKPDGTDAGALRSRISAATRAPANSAARTVTFIHWSWIMFARTPHALSAIPQGYPTADGFAMTARRW